MAVTPRVWLDHHALRAFAAAGAGFELAG